MISGAAMDLGSDDCVAERRAEGALWLAGVPSLTGQFLKIIRAAFAHRRV